VIAFNQKYIRLLKNNVTIILSIATEVMNERGIGGIFYDHLKPSADVPAEKLFAFAQSNGNAFIEAYIPIVDRRKGLEFNERQKHWQLLRMGKICKY
jgi:coproporphyrinogen III oxidase